MNKMKTYLTGVAAMLMLGTVNAAEPGSNKNLMNARSGSYMVMKSSSEILWEGSKPGGDHMGSVGIKQGAMQVDNGMITGGEFIMDMNRITVSDIRDEGMNRRLVNHLKSPDFFDAAKYPEARFMIDEVTPTGAANGYMMKGSLTIKEITHPISFKAKIEAGGETITGTSEPIVLDRTKWNVNHQSKSVFANLKDSFIYDEMTIQVRIVTSL